MHSDVDTQLRRNSGFGPCLRNHCSINLPQTHRYHYGNGISQHLFVLTATPQIAILPTQFHFIRVRLDSQPKSNQTQHHYRWYRRKIDFGDVHSHIQMEVFQSRPQQIDLWKHSTLLHNCCERVSLPSQAQLRFLILQVIASWIYPIIKTHKQALHNLQ